jgi:hypothetical protein
LFSDDIAQLGKQLSSLGATRVLTYDDLADKTLRDKIKEWTNGSVRVYREREREKFLKLNLFIFFLGNSFGSELRR